MSRPAPLLFLLACLLFFFSGYPHLEEAYRVAELLFPELGLKRDEQRAGFRNEFGAKQIFAGGSHGGNLKVVSGS